MVQIRFSKISVKMEGECEENDVLFPVHCLRFVLYVTIYVCMCMCSNLLSSFIYSNVVIYKVH